jgi:hypothetical protein
MKPINIILTALLLSLLATLAPAALKPPKH